MADTLRAFLVWPPLRSRRSQIDAPSLRQFAILRLFLACCPANVSRFVVTMVVDSLKGVFGGRLRPHVRKEINERCLPALAYRNSSAAISFIVRSVWIKASRLHAEPVLVALRASFCIFLQRLRSFCEFATETATRFVPSQFEGRGRRLNPFAAIALTGPDVTLSLWRFYANPFNGDQSTKPQMTDVFVAHMSEYSMELEG